MTRGRCWASGQTIPEDQHSGASASSLDADDLEGSHQAALRRPPATSVNNASDYTTSNSDRIPVSGTIEYILVVMAYVCRAAVTKPVPLIWRDLEAFHGDAIVQILNFSRDKAATYHTAASICSIGSTYNLNVILRDKLSREHLTFLLRDAVLALSRSHKEGMQKKTIEELEKRVAVFGAALFHLYFSVGSWALIHGPPEAPPGDHPSAAPRIAKNRFEENKVLHLKNDLEWLCHVLDDRLGGQPPLFTSMRLAAGLLWASIDPGVSIFEEASRLVAYQSEEIDAAHFTFWSQLALLVLACNRRGRGTNDRSIQEHFLEIQNAYNTQPTNEFSDTVYQAIRGHSGEKTRLPSDVFKLAWKLLVQLGRQGEHTARALGNRVPFLGILESKVRDDEKPLAYREFFQCRRSECFEVVLDTVRSVPYAERIEASASWRSQAKFVFKAINHYAMCIIELGDPLHPENRESLRLIRSIKALVPPIDPARADPAQAQGASETEYRSEAKTFEETYKRFESFIRSGQRISGVSPERALLFGMKPDRAAMATDVDGRK
ncbi:hypothetical protein FS837_011451 [Tulasnella sp. UAMH 9824]|nr:hypothetical protein FS837_011451 [Tulasnella sp. UAMH 9824]